jgi:haloacetate dehalogenase
MPANTRVHPTARPHPLRSLMPGFDAVDVEVDGATIHAAVGGDGPPLLLLHGHPQNHLTWHRIAPALAASYSVVAADLRGYGDSSKPSGGARHRGYAKRTMAADQVSLMRALGHPRFAVVGHDRGARVAHRMGLDHPSAVSRMALLDIAPTATMYERTNMEFATRYFWWFFLIQPFDLPERLIGADPEYFLRRHLEGQFSGPVNTPPEVIADYLRCYSDPATVHGICEDYRASAGIDLEHDAADRGERLEMPVLVLWGAQGTVGQLYDVAATWRPKAADLTARAMPCGHTPQEELPGELIDRLSDFLAGPHGGG